MQYFPLEYSRKYNVIKNGNVQVKSTNTSKLWSLWHFCTEKRRNKISTVFTGGKRHLQTHEGDGQHNHTVWMGSVALLPHQLTLHRWQNLPGFRRKTGSHLGWLLRKWQTCWWSKAKIAQAVFETWRLWWCWWQSLFWCRRWIPARRWEIPNYEARRFVNSAEASPSCFTHPKIVNWAQKKCQELDREANPEHQRGGK